MFEARRSDISHSSDDSDSSLQSPVQRYARPVLAPPNAPLRVRRKRPQNKEFHLKPVRLIDLIEAGQCTLLLGKITEVREYTTLCVLTKNDFLAVTK